VWLCRGNHLLVIVTFVCDAWLPAVLVTGQGAVHADSVVVAAAAAWSTSVYMWGSACRPGHVGELQETTACSVAVRMLLQRSSVMLHLQSCCKQECPYTRALCF
jgi:hypothetical protein